MSSHEVNDSRLPPLVSRGYDGKADIFHRAVLRARVLTGAGLVRPDRRGRLPLSRGVRSKVTVSVISVIW
jgi:hypothetical protein